MSVSCECCVLSGTGLCDGLISCPEVYHRVYVCVFVCAWVGRCVTEFDQV
jgi:hypothetical protein